MLEMGKSPLGRFRWELDADEHVLSETHTSRGHKSIRRGFPHRQIMLTDWVASGEDGTEVCFWMHPDGDEWPVLR